MSICKLITLPGLVAATLLVPSFQCCEAAPWVKHTIVESNPLNGNINTVIANDWNRDGHMDVMTSFGRQVVLILGPNWEERLVVHQFSEKDSQRKVGAGCMHSCGMDVDRDGDLDFCGSNQTVFWLECPENPKDLPWKFRTIDDEIHGTHCLIVGDVDGDGEDDLIANSGRTGEDKKFPDSITWQKIPENPRTATNWIRHVFADRDAPGASHYTGIGDVNGDGLADISCAAKGGEKIPNGQWFAWWEQPAGQKKGPWKKHLLAEKQTGATNIIPFDLNGDQVMDFAATRGHGKGILWFRGPDFSIEEIDSAIVNPHSLAIADMDADGDPDLLTCGLAKDGVAACYSNDGKGNFQKLVLGIDQGSYDTRTVDMDADGDLDVLIAGHFSQNVVWYENPLKD